MNPVRKKQVLRMILETLEMARGYALESSMLETHVNDLLRPPLTGAEWDHATEHLCAGEYIREVPSDFDPSLKQWCITERGKTLLRSN